MRSDQTCGSDTSWLVFFFRMDHPDGPDPTQFTMELSGHIARLPLTKFVANDPKLFNIRLFSIRATDHVLLHGQGGPSMRVISRTVAAILLTLVAIAPLAVSTAWAQDDLDPDATVRFLHASPDAPAIDVLVDGLLVAENISFETATEFVPLSEGEHQIQVVPTGEDAAAAVLDESIDVDSNEAYTVAVANRLNELQLVSVQSNTSTLDDSSQSRVRLVNLSPDAGEVDLFQTGGDQWFDDVDFLESTDHRDVDAGPYNLEIRPNESDAVSVVVEGLEILSAQEYTFYLLGLNENESLVLLPLSVTVSVSCGESLGLEAQSDASCIRLVHAAAGTEAVDVYVEDSLVAEGVEAGSFADFQIVPPGDDNDVNVKFVSTGGSVDEPLVDSTLELGDGSAYDIVLGGNPDDLKVVSEEVSLAPLPDGQSRIRLTHLAPDTENVDLAVTDGDAFFTDVGFEDTTDDAVIDAGTYDVQVRQSGESTVFVRMDELVIDAGMAYSLIAYGNADDGSFAVLVLTAPVSIQSGAVGNVTSVGTPDMATAEAEVVDQGTPEPVGTAEVEEATPGS